MTEICDNCTKGSKLSGTPRGRMIETTPLQAYFASPSTNQDEQNPTYTSKAIVISPDIFGMALDNPKLMADIFAPKCGVDVWVPDTFKGNPPAKAEELEPYVPDHAGQKLSFASKLSGVWVMLKALPRIVSARPGVSDVWLTEFITNLREKYGYQKIALHGYCWGGGQAIRLGTIPGLIDLSIPMHPGAMFAGAMPNVIVPIIYFLAEEDDQWPTRVAEAVQKEWEKKADAPKLQFITYPGTAHGFGCRPNLAIPVVKEAWEKYINDFAEVIKENL